jgi:hypothetical protein
MFHARIANYFPQNGTKEHKAAQSGTKWDKKNQNGTKKTTLAQLGPKCYTFFKLKVCRLFWKNKRVEQVESRLLGGCWRCGMVASVPICCDLVPFVGCWPLVAVWDGGIRADLLRFGTICGLLAVGGGVGWWHPCRFVAIICGLLAVKLLV